MQGEGQTKTPINKLMKKHCTNDKQTTTATQATTIINKNICLITNLTDRMINKIKHFQRSERKNEREREIE